VRAADRTFEVATRPVEAGPASNGWVLMIRDVTAELMAQQQLQRQERLAAIGQLAAGIAHDFNNIMSVVTVYVQLLEAMPELGERARERLRIIDRQALRATDMIRQILDFSRRSVIEPQTIDLLPLLVEQIKLLEWTLGENIEIALTHSAGPFMVHADGTRLAQVIMNLSINARDAMPEGGRLAFDLEYVVTTSRKNAPLPSMGVGEWVRLTVADTGVGMAPSILQHIFEPFYTTKEPGRGTGLGLPQVHGIIGQHGGYIDVASQKGAGTRITIYLPAVSLLAVDARDLRAPAELPQGRGETVLLVEDEPVLRESMADLLMLWNYKVVKAANGQQALDILSANQQVALVLTDVVMPVMGGIGLLKQMRQRKLTTPVVIVTGHPLRDELEGLRQLGLTAWLNKPPSTAQLAHTLAQVLHN
jgi:signal transduction histidine kinase